MERQRIKAEIEVTKDNKDRSDNIFHEVEGNNEGEQSDEVVNELRRGNRHQQ